MTEEEEHHHYHPETNNTAGQEETNSTAKPEIAITIPIVTFSSKVNRIPTHSHDAWNYTQNSTANQTLNSTEKEENLILKNDTKEANPNTTTTLLKTTTPKPFPIVIVAVSTGLVVSVIFTAVVVWLCARKKGPQVVEAPSRPDLPDEHSDNNVTMPPTPRVKSEPQVAMLTDRTGREELEEGDAVVPKVLTKDNSQIF